MAYARCMRPPTLEWCDTPVTLYAPAGPSCQLLLGPAWCPASGPKAACPPAAALLSAQEESSNITLARIRAEQAAA